MIDSICGRLKMSKLGVKTLKNQENIKGRRWFKNWVLGSLG
ncbi:hypothetical protein SPONL_543 [uncultured Candidatus Thioglobus sp.]|nr:hypothetical protein SPONL_543 [uncultured Candidatus Thioglobus sp.]